MVAEPLPSLLGIPAQSKRESDAFDPREKQVEEWIAHLPRGSIGECAKRLFSALRETNRMVIAERTRFDMLERFREPVAQIEQALKKYYINQSMPLSAKIRSIATLARELNAEYAIGYKILAEQEIVGSSRLNKKTVAIVIHRALRYLEKLLLVGYQTYELPPVGTWNQIHRLYVFAEQSRLEDGLIKDHPFSGEMHDCSIRDLYKEIILLGAAEPYRLRQPVTDTIQRQLESWAPLCRIQPGNDADAAGAGALLINLDRDQAPIQFIGKPPQDNPELRRYLDTRKLIEVLSRLQSDAAQETAFSGDQLNTPTADTYKRLIQSWGGKTKRLYSRVPCGGKVSLTISLNATHRFITHLLQDDLHETALFCGEARAALDRLVAGAPLQDDPDVETVLEIRSHYHSTPIYGLNQLDDRIPDVWDNSFSYNIEGGYAVDLNKSSSTGEKSAPPPLDCVCVNESADGYCIVGMDKDSIPTQRVRVGELIGIHYTNDDGGKELAIGAIRRIRHSEGRMELGIQKLAPCAATVATAPIKTPQNWEQFSRSLFLPEMPAIKRPATLVTHAWHGSGDHLVLNYRGRRLQICLTNVVETSGIFTRFEFETVRKRPAETAPEQNNQGKDQDDFDDVWSLI